MARCNLRCERESQAGAGNLSARTVWTVYASTGLPRTLKIQFKRKLQNAGSGGCRLNFAEGGVGLAGIRIGKLRRVPQIERFGAKLHGCGIAVPAEPEILAEGGVDILLSGPLNDSRERIAKSGCDPVVANNRIISRKATGVDVVVNFAANRA